MSAPGSPSVPSSIRYGSPTARVVHVGDASGSLTASIQARSGSFVHPTTPGGNLLQSSGGGAILIRSSTQQTALSPRLGRVQSQGQTQASPNMAAKEVSSPFRPVHRVVTVRRDACSAIEGETSAAAGISKTQGNSPDADLAHNPTEDDGRVASLRGLLDAVTRPQLPRRPKRQANNRRSQNDTSSTIDFLEGLQQDSAASDQTPSRQQAGNAETVHGDASPEIPNQMRTLLDERLSRPVEAEQESQPLEGNMEQRWTALLEQRITKEREELVDVFASMCASVETRAIAKIEVVDMELCKLKTEFRRDTLKQSESMEDDISRVSAQFDKSQNDFSQLESSASEVEQLRHELVQAGVMLSSTPQSARNAVVNTIAEQVLLVVKTDYDICNMQYQYEMFKQQLQELSAGQPAGPTETASTSISNAETKEPQVRFSDFLQLRDTFNEIVKVLGKELQSQRHKQALDFDTLEKQFTSLKQSNDNVGNSAREDTFSGRERAEVPASEVESLGEVVKGDPLPSMSGQPEVSPAALQPET